MKIGIPRALLYYQYYPMWQTFFEALGVEVVLSPTTTQTMLADGAARVVADTCLPVKVFLGHVLALVDKCDWIFIPAIRSVEKNIYNCSKFLGLPDMTRAVIPEAPPILEVEIDVNRGKRRLYQAIYQLGRHFTWNPLSVRHASILAWQSYLSYRKLMANHQLAPPQALARLAATRTTPEATEGITEGEVPSRPLASTRATIALVGHPYLLYDEYINHRLIPRLEQANIKVVTPEMLTTEELDTAITRLVGKAYWTYEEEVVGAGGHYLQNGTDGVIGIMTFGCGPDSLMMDMVRRQAARLKATPFMSLTMEEHTAEAGIITRLEAFTDMLHRKKRKQIKVCV